jgi:hypothetical protein
MFLTHRVRCQELSRMGTPARRPLAVEPLENRLNLSTLAGIPRPPAAAAGATVQEVGSLKYRIDAWAATQAGNTFGASWTNPQYADAQRFFNRFRHHSTPDNPTPSPAPAPTPTPAPTPAPAPENLAPVTIRQDAKGSLTRLTILGTSGNDSVVVTQSGNTLTITANGTTTSVTGAFAEIAIYGDAGNDTLTVQSSVHLPALLYGGAGNNTLTAKGSAKSYLVTIGAGADVLTGNGVNTSFWADAGDTVNASSAEAANGGVHRVANFYQPFTTNAASPDYVSTTLAGQNLRDPTDSGATVRLSNSLWGAGPAMTDINQGGVGDCYYLASLQSLAIQQPGRLQEMAVDLGDGTYAVQFKRNGTTTYVRVDGDLPAGYWNGLKYAHPASGGPLWAAIMEKAYAVFRTGAATYASINSGWTGAALADLGVATSTFNTSASGAGSLFTSLTTALAAGKAVAAITIPGVPGGVPVIGSHAYSVVSTAVEAGVQYLTLRNPWGTDGAGSDANPYDGLVKITLAQFVSAFSAGSISI